jgi:large conductance mechanosensitive channel
VREFLNDFRKFILRGNLVELAVALILALYFKDVVDTFTNGIVLAFIAAVFGQPSFQSITIHIGDGALLVGVFINAVLNFLIVGFALFVIVKGYETLKEKFVRSGESEPLTQEAELLTETRDLIAAQPR